VSGIRWDVVLIVFVLPGVGILCRSIADCCPGKVHVTIFTVRIVRIGLFPLSVNSGTPFIDHLLRREPNDKVLNAYITLPEYLESV
jgi:hypothetical protein